MCRAFGRGIAALLRLIAIVGGAALALLVVIGIVVSENDRYNREQTAARNEARTADAWENNRFSTVQARYDRDQQNLVDEWTASAEDLAPRSACNPNYGETSGGCAPADRDYDCPELHAMGIGDIPIIGQDWQRLDGLVDYQTGIWITLPNGVGCEWVGE